MKQTILLTVDLEDWFQVENLRACFPYDSWNECELRLEKPVHNLLKLFETHQVKATFFVLGWLAERLPQLIKTISNYGHEIASHGYSHEVCYNLSYTQLLNDIQKSKNLLEDIIGKEVVGYRAPSFSINSQLITVLKDTDFIYDSSYNDFVLHSRYGSLPGKWSEIKPGLLQNSDGFYEIPIQNLKLLGQVIPWGGGGYFRIVPTKLFIWGVKKILRKCNSYIFYCHPWEFDPDQPKVCNLRVDYYFRHYMNIKKNPNKLNCFLKAFSKGLFITCSQYIFNSKNNELKNYTID